MNKKLTALKLAYSELGYSDRKEFKEFVEKYEDSTFTERDNLNESFRKSLGPINSATCPVCGK